MHVDRLFYARGRGVCVCVRCACVCARVRECVRARRHIAHIHVVDIIVELPASFLDCATGQSHSGQPKKEGAEEKRGIAARQVRQVFTISHVCRAARDAMREKWADLPPVRMGATARARIPKHMQHVWPLFGVSIDMTEEECREAAQFWEELPRYPRVVEVL